MKVTYDWLKEYADFDLIPEELVEKLTMLGLEVDSCTQNQWQFDGIVVGKVLRKEGHQKSDHLWICEVEIGAKRLSVVCGAPNVEVGQKVPVAADGTRLPNGQVIKKTTIRGVDSEGMICSEAELGISSRAEGIMVLPEETEQGRKLSEVVGESEIVIDIDVTPNRPDCFGAIGIAREIAALAGTSLRKPKTSVKENARPIEDYIKIEIHDKDKCPRYSARFISGIQVKPSPWWLARRLEAIGVRSINNVVDITNYIMLETGQPLHAFDYDLLNGNEIHVRTAQNGTSFTTLDDKQHILNSESLMICDANGEVAIGGVMGGLNSEVSDTTTNVLLESAHFDPVNVRRTAKRLGIFSEASRRFERGVDPNGTVYALDRAAELMVHLAGGKVAKGVLDVYPEPRTPTAITLRSKRVETLLGIKIDGKKIEQILSALGFTVRSQDDGDLTVDVPTFRPDIKREADLIEEVARHFGYDNIPVDDTATIHQLVPSNQSEAFLRRIHQTMISLGFSRAITYSMISQAKASHFSNPDHLVSVKNPIGEDFSTLRPSILPGLLTVVAWNLNRKNSDLKLFEVGTVFGKSKEGVVEDISLTAVLTGNLRTDSWKREAIASDIHDLKGVVETLVFRNGDQRPDFHPKPLQFTSDKALRISIGRREIGFLAELNHQTLSKFDIEQPVFACEVNLSLFFENTSREKTFQPIPKFPPITRDISVTIDAAVEAGSLLEQIKSVGGKFLQFVEVFDVFTGEQVGQGQKSIAFRLKFYSLERTLTEQEVDSEMKTILGALEKSFSARLRD